MVFTKMLSYYHTIFKTTFCEIVRKQVFCVSLKDPVIDNRTDERKTKFYKCGSLAEILKSYSLFKFCNERIT